MTSTLSNTVALAFAWLAYFLLHSLLASLRVKRWVAQHLPGLMPAYRLIFNTMAVLLLLPPLAMTFLFRGDPLWQWTGPWHWVSLGLTGAAVFGFAWSLYYYDGQEFLGIRQWRGRIRSVEDQERMHISPLHRYVRHPWYFLGLILVWSRDMDPAFLTSAIAITLYFVVGSRLEEHKLIEYHGDAYRAYRTRVPSLIPLPWRYLTKDEARRLARKAKA
jgi:protein-S-isoprenylcysteine O-methyltransferase Ste14